MNTVDVDRIRARLDRVSRYVDSFYKARPNNERDLLLGLIIVCLEDTITEMSKESA